VTRFDAFRFRKMTIWGRTIMLDESDLSRSFFVFWSTQHHPFDESEAREIAEEIARGWGAKIVSVWPTATTKRARAIILDKKAFRWRAAFSY